MTAGAELRELGAPARGVVKRTQKRTEGGFGVPIWAWIIIILLVLLLLGGFGYSRR
jgi:hypothetical protein